MATKTKKPALKVHTLPVVNLLDLFPEEVHERVIAHLQMKWGKRLFIRKSRYSQPREFVYGWEVEYAFSGTTSPPDLQDSGKKALKQLEKLGPCLVVLLAPKVQLKPESFKYSEDR